MIKTFTLFLETTFSKQSIFDREFDYEKQYADKNFINDTELLTKLYIENDNKDIYLFWNNTEEHIIKERIKNRTPVNSITEFNEILKKYIIILFDKYFKKITKHMSDSKLNIIAVRMSELDAFIIIQYNPDHIFEDDTVLNMITIVPLLRRVADINRIFYL